MKILSVNIGKKKNINNNKNTFSTGIYKYEVQGQTRVNKLNLAGDEQADPSVHGGLWKAVYMYPYEHYEKWINYLSIEKLNYGAFGENLTTNGLDENNIFIGDILKVGSSVLSVSEPRLPCYKLNYKLNNSEAGKFMSNNLLTGFYLRVIEEGFVTPGAEIKILERGPGKVSIKKLSNFLLNKSNSVQELEILLDYNILSDKIKNKIYNSRN